MNNTIEHNRGVDVKQLAQPKSAQQVEVEALEDAVVVAGISEQKARALPEARRVDAAHLAAMEGGADPQLVVTQESIMVSLFKLFTKGASGEMELKVQSALQKLQGIMGDVQTGRLLNDTEKKRAALERNHDRLLKVQEAMDEAKETAKRGGIWQKISAAFSMIAAVVTVALGAMLVMTGGGALLGAAMIAGGVMGIVSGADAIAAMSSDSGKGFLGKGASIAIAVMGAVLMIATLGVSLVTGAVSKAASMLAGTAAKSGGVAAEAGASVAAKAAQSVAMTRATSVGQGMAAVSEVGGMGGEIGAQSIAVKASKFTEQGEIFRSEGIQARAAGDFIDDQINELIAKLKDFAAAVNAMIGFMIRSLEARGESLGRVRFK